MTEINIQKSTLSIIFSEPATIFDLISNGIIITDENSYIIYTNPAFSKITGYSKTEVNGANPGMLHSGRHEREFYQDMWEKILNQGFWEGEIWNRRKSGQIFPEFLTITRINQPATNKFYYIGVFSDISFLKKDVAKKLHLAFYDPLTELPNRNLYLERVNHIIHGMKDDKQRSIVIFYMDLDHFKQVNDTYGHCTGDKLLKVVGERLAAMTRSGDTIARMGGDEFTAILTTMTDKTSAIGFANRIQKKIEEPYHIDGHLINISISIGISFYPADSKNVDTLLDDADQAMYAAKKIGSTVVCFDTL
jgi:diguanylate cyclase (GGDEF)-like protein/PAS domain S-box-containing protein